VTFFLTPTDWFLTNNKNLASADTSENISAATRWFDVCRQLSYHPGHDDLVTHIISLAFRHFKYREM